MKTQAISYMNLLLQSDARYSRADGTGGATIGVESPEHTCCFCVPNAADQTFTRKESVLGKKQVLLSARFDPAADSSAPTSSTSIHLISDRAEGRMPKQIATVYRRVACELEGGVDDARKRLDVVLMGAALAALNATTKMPSD